MQAQKVNDAGIATVKYTDHLVEKRSEKLGFFRALGLPIVALVWLVSGEITGNKRHLIL